MGFNEHEYEPPRIANFGRARRVTLKGDIRPMATLPASCAKFRQSPAA